MTSTYYSGSVLLVRKKFSAAEKGPGVRYELFVSRGASNIAMIYIALGKLTVPEIFGISLS